MSKYENLKSYLQTHYNFHANLGQYNLGDREQLETEAKWRMISDIMDYVDNLDLEDNVIKFPKTDDATGIFEFPNYLSAYGEDMIFGADTVPFNAFAGTDVISFDVDDDK
jgi:hypothetical protein